MLVPPLAPFACSDPMPRSVLASSAMLPPDPPPAPRTIQTRTKMCHDTQQMGRNATSPVCLPQSLQRAAQIHNLPTHRYARARERELTGSTLGTTLTATIHTAHHAHAPTTHTSTCPRVSRSCSSPCQAVHTNSAVDLRIRRHCRVRQHNDCTTTTASHLRRRHTSRSLHIHTCNQPITSTNATPTTPPMLPLSRQLDQMHQLPPTPTNNHSSTTSPRTPSHMTDTKRIYTHNHTSTGPQAITPLTLFVGHSKLPHATIALPPPDPVDPSPP